MTKSLIGAVGLKEFVFGTSFLSVSLKDQDSSGAAPSSALPVSRSSLRAGSPSPSAALLLGPPCLGLHFPGSGAPWPSLWAQPRCSLPARPRQNLQGTEGQGEGGKAQTGGAMCLLWPNLGSSLHLCFLLHNWMGSDLGTLETEVGGPREEVP